MYHKTKHIVSFSMMLLILFSTIGFNVISTFCDGCNDEHTTIAFAIDDNNISCECCSAETDYSNCCSTTKEHRDNHHHSKAIFAKLSIDSPEAKPETRVSNTPVFILQLVSILFEFNQEENYVLQISNYNLPLPLSGRQILSIICILRN